MKQKAQKTRIVRLSMRYAQTLLMNANGTKPYALMTSRIEKLFLDPSLDIFLLDSIKHQTDHIFELPLSLEDIKKAFAKDVLPLSQEMPEILNKSRFFRMRFI